MEHRHILTTLAAVALATVCVAAFAQAGAGDAAGAAPTIAAPAVAAPVAAPAPDRAAAIQKALAAMPTPPAIAVSGNFVYVIQGNTLYQFSVDGLKLVAQAQLGPEPGQAAARRKAKKRKAILPALDAGNPNPALGPAAPTANPPATNPPADGNAPTVVVPPAGAPK